MSDAYYQTITRLRDDFVLAMLDAIVPLLHESLRRSDKSRDEVLEFTARTCYEFADALLKARDK